MVKIFHERYRLNGNSSARIYAAPGLVKLFGNVFAENENKDTGGEVGRQTQPDQCRLAKIGFKGIEERVGAAGGD